MLRVDFETRVETMNAHRITSSSGVVGLAVALVMGIALSAAPVARADPEGRYQQRNLVSDGFVTAEHQPDANLVNPWGIAFNPFGFAWISDNGSGMSTLYDGAGVLQAPIVTIPPAAGATRGNPTGIVFNGSGGFVVTNGTSSGPARFIFATEDGVIAGWSPAVDFNHAILVKDNSPSGALYKGLALSAGGNGLLLYATDFHNNRIDVWDSNFAAVVLPAGAFTDPTIPPGFAPFGIQAINGNVYVTYAKQDSDQHDDVQGKGLGYVDVFDPNGVLLNRVVSKGKLNAPWGLTLAPAGFGEFSNSLLVGNFGDGRINAYDLATGAYRGTLKGSDGRPIEIEGLWGIAFGNGFAGQPVNTLFFTAGPGDEEHGLYGRLDAIPGKDHGHDQD
jgi:uncharacterized protein (TIGR03118 family)